MALPRIIANPLKLTGCSLPPQVVLVCRLLALALLLTDHRAQIQTPFLPFLDFFDALPPELFQRTLQTAIVLGALGTLFTTRIRTFAAITGVVILLAVLSSRAYYGNNKTFVGLMLVLSSLSASTGPPRLLHWQFALVYFGAGLNKLLDADWQSGQFFEHWATDRLQNPVYIWFSAQLPPLAAGKIFCWYTIVAELSLAALICIPRFHTWVIWGSGLFQSGLLLFTGDPFNLFFYGMQSTLYAFAIWPEDEESRDLLHRPLFPMALLAALAFAPGPLSRRVLVSAALILVLPPIRARLSRQELRAKETSEVSNKS